MSFYVGQAVSVLEPDGLECLGTIVEDMGDGLYMVHTDDGVDWPYAKEPEWGSLAPYETDYEI